MEKLGGKLRINPPVRKKADSAKLWRKLQYGEIECVSSDHAPWPIEKKNKSSIFENACGIPGVEILFPVLFSEGVAKEKISIFTLAKVVMENPAKIFGLFPKKGTLIPGSDADIVVLDPEKRWIVIQNELHPNVGWSPYEGMELTGKVDMTIVRGKIVFNKGEITAPKGYGRFIRPTGTP
jgi:allantoinase